MGMQMSWKPDHIYSWPSLNLPHNSGMGTYIVGLIKMQNIPNFGWISVDPLQKGRVFVIVHWHGRSLSPTFDSQVFWKRENFKGTEGTVFYKLDRDNGGAQYIFDKLENPSNYIKIYREPHSLLNYCTGTLYSGSIKYKWVGEWTDELVEAELARIGQQNIHNGWRKLHIPYYVCQKKY